VLLAVWGVVLVVLAGWGGLASPRAPAPAPASVAAAVPVLPARPSEALLALWIRWDAPPGHPGSVVLEAGRRWTPTEALTWRRRVHPGWNLLTWTDVAALPPGSPLTVRILEGAAGSWAVSGPLLSSRYGLVHLAALRGLIAAAVLGAAVGVVWAARGLRARRRRPGLWELALAGTAILALWLRVHRLTAQSLWFDEILTAIGAQSLAWLLHTPHLFWHPPVQYVAAWVVGGGSDEGWLRAPFVAAGVASSVALALLGRRLCGPAAGLLAGLLLATSPFHVELSQLARPYALLLLLAIVSSLALRRALRTADPVDWLGFSALAALGLYTHYLAATVVAGQAIVAAAALVCRRRGRDGLPAGLGFAGTAILFWPWTPMFARLPAARADVPGASPASLLELAQSVLVPELLVPGAGGILTVAVAAYGAVTLRRRPLVALALVLWVVLPLATVWLARSTHFVAGRHLAAAMPALLLLVATGATGLARALAGAVARAGGIRPAAARRAGLATGVAVFLAAWGTQSASGLTAYYGERLLADWRAVAAVLDRVTRPGDRVIATLGAAYPLRRYFRAELIEADPATLPAAVGPRRAGARVWIVTAEGWDRDPALWAWLERHAVRVGEVPPSWSVPRLFIHRVRPAPAAGRTE
jgi:hypothetical protein